MYVIAVVILIMVFMLLWFCIAPPCCHGGATIVKNSPLSLDTKELEHLVISELTTLVP